MATLTSNITHHVDASIADEDIQLGDLCLHLLYELEAGLEVIQIQDEEFDLGRRIGLVHIWVCTERGDGFLTFRCRSNGNDNPGGS